MTGVRKVEMFQTTSGKLFEILTDAENYELVDGLAKDAMYFIGGTGTTSFTSGDGIIKISKDSYMSAYGKSKDIMMRLYNEEMPPPRRVDDDSEIPSSVKRLMHIFRCISDCKPHYERVGQPCYVLHREKMESQRVIKEIS